MYEELATLVGKGIVKMPLVGVNLRCREYDEVMDLPRLLDGAGKTVLGVGESGEWKPFDERTTTVTIE